AFAPRLPARAFFCEPTAAALWGLPLPRPPRALHIGVRAGHRRVEAEGVIAHHFTLRDADIRVHRGVRVTSPARTWCDLAAAPLSLAQLVAVGDRILWRKAPLATPAQLGEVLGS